MYSLAVLSTRAARHKFAQVVAIIVFLALMILVPAVPAAAAAFVQTTGSPGSVTVPVVSATDLNYGWGPTLTLQTGTGLWANRSPGYSGSQDVHAIYAIYRWNGAAWAEVTRSTWKITVNPGQYASFPALFAQPTTGAGYYKVMWAVSWHVAGSTTALATAIIDSNLASDYRCVTTLRPCRTGAGWIQLGRLYSLGGGW